jgi:hypothetical protein
MIYDYVNDIHYSLQKQAISPYPTTSAKALSALCRGIALSGF